MINRTETVAIWCDFCDRCEQERREDVPRTWRPPYWQDLTCPTYGPPLTFNICPDCFREARDNSPGRDAGTTSFLMGMGTRGRPT